jgi:hypothetical protein
MVRVGVSPRGGQPQNTTPIAPPEDPNALIGPGGSTEADWGGAPANHDVHVYLHGPGDSTPWWHGSCSVPAGGTGGAYAIYEKPKWSGEVIVGDNENPTVAELLVSAMLEGQMPPGMI